MPLFSMAESVCLSDDGTSDDGSCSHYHHDEFLIDSFLNAAMKDDEDDDESVYFGKKSSTRDILNNTRPRQITKSISLASGGSSSMRTRQLERAVRRRRYSNASDINSSTVTSASTLKRPELLRAVSALALTTPINSRNNGSSSVHRDCGSSCNHDHPNSFNCEKKNDDDEEYLKMMISQSTDDEKYMRRNSRRDDKKKIHSPTSRNSPKKNKDSQLEVESLLAELEKFKYKFAEAQSEADHYKLQYRHLHVEYQDMQTYSSKLQKENKMLRNRGKSSMSSNTSVTSTSTNTSMSSNTSWFVQSLERMIPTKKSNNHQHRLRPFQEYPTYNEIDETTKTESIGSTSNSEPSSDSESQNSESSGNTPKLSEFFSREEAIDFSREEAIDFEKPLRNISFTRRNQLGRQISQLSLHPENDNRSTSPVTAANFSIDENYAQSNEDDQATTKHKNTTRSSRTAHKCKPQQVRQRCLSIDSDDLDELDLTENPNLSEKTEKTIESDSSNGSE